MLAPPHPLSFTCLFFGYAQDDDRTTGSLNWVVQLQKYMQFHVPMSAQLGADRKACVELLQSNPTSAEAWCQFLETEERISAEAPAAGASALKSKSAVTLANLYHRATELVPRVRGQAPLTYMKLWVGYAKHQW